MGSITEGELVAAILAACNTADCTDGALTVRELCERTGHWSGWVQEQLRRLDVQGRLQCVRKPMRHIDGTTSGVPAYKLRQE